MSKHRPYASLRFCPKCGVESIQRDADPFAGVSDKVEYVCRTCSFGFRIGPSHKVEIAHAMHKEERTNRTDRGFHWNVSAEARQAFEENFPEPWKHKLWRAWRRIQGIEPGACEQGWRQNS